jgi:hypothetical protein
MSYIGAEPTTAACPFDQFSGNGTTTAFTLTYAPASTTSIIVAISGVVQNPNLYSVIGTTITFSPAPPTGTNNISVLYLGLPVQIGTPIPGSRLELALGSAANPSLTFLGDTNTGIFSPAADTIAFTEGGTEVGRFDSSGNFGMGTSSPNKAGVARALTLNSGAGNIVEFCTNDTRTGWIYGDNNLTAVAAAGSRYLSLETNSVERARITSGGGFLVGKTTQGETVNGFQVATNGVAATSADANAWVFYNTTASAYRFFVSAAGTINATSTTITAISDQRWKENIRDLDDGLEKVLELKPRKFDWKKGKGEDTKNARGFIAQELETVFPDMVTEWIDPAPEGEEPYKAVNANLIPTLVKAIQELKAELDATKAEVALLKGAA